jgi:nuclear pore complex protein Nup205
VIEDSQLANLVSSRPDHLKAFYTYETKMALLTRLASTATGSEMLLESGLMVKLSEMSVFSSRPETSNAEAMMESNDTEVIPSALSRYQQIVFPALKLCEAIMASLGSENRSAASQVLHFVTAHECLVRVGLHYSNLFTISGLQELSLLTGVIARSVTFEAVNGDVDSTYELSSHLSRIQRQMLALTSHFGQNECLVRKMEASGLFSKEVKGKAVQLVLEINANCMMYAATMVGKGKQTRVILAPNLSEAFEAVDHGTHGRSMSLGNAVLMIQNLVAHLLATRAALRDLKDKLATVHHLSSAELSAFLPEDQGPNSRLAPVDQRSVAAERIRTSIHEKDHDMLLATSGVENTIFVIWKHLDHFFHSVSARQHIGRQKKIVFTIKKTNLIISGTSRREVIIQTETRLKTALTSLYQGKTENLKFV